MRAQPVTEFLRFSQLDLREVRARPAAGDDGKRRRTCAACHDRDRTTMRTAVAQAFGSRTTNGGCARI